MAGVAVAAGRRIGAYELVEPIGRGGSAVVFRAFDAARSLDVAIKVIAGAHLADQNFRARFRQEAQLVSQLRHPHILEVLDSGEATSPDTSPALSALGEQDRLAYLVTEYMPGGSLADQIGAQRTPRERCTLAVALAEQIGAALDWAHQAGVLHRDVKPSNVLVAGDGRFVLGDFGLARVLQSGFSLHLTATGLVAGTPAYMSPEQAMGHPADGRSDLYGLAVVLYEMLAARVPFDAEAPMAVMLAQVHQPPPPPCLVAPELPPELDPVLLRALEKDPDARYQSAQDLASALRGAVVAAYGESAIATGAFPAVLAGNGPDKVRVAAQPRPPDPVRRARRLRLGRLAAGVAAAALTLSLFAGSGAFMAFGPGRPRLASWITQFIADTVPPGIDEALPRNDERVRGTRPTITVRFSRAMDQESVQSALQLLSATSHEPVPLDFTWEKQLLVAVPQVDLDPNTAYVLTIESTAHDLEGRPLGGQLLRRFLTPLPEVPKLPNSALAAPAAPSEAQRGAPTLESRPVPSSPTAPQPRPSQPPARVVPPTAQPTAYTPPTVLPLLPDQSRVAGVLADAEGHTKPADEVGELDPTFATPGTAQTQVPLNAVDALVPVATVSPAAALTPAAVSTAGSSPAPAATGSPDARGTATATSPTPQRTATPGFPVGVGGAPTAARTPGPGTAQPSVPAVGGTAAASPSGSAATPSTAVATAQATPSSSVATPVPAATTPSPALTPVATPAAGVASPASSVSPAAAASATAAPLPSASPSAAPASPTVTRTT